MYEMCAINDQPNDIFFLLICAATVSIILAV